MSDFSRDNPPNKNPLRTGQDGKPSQAQPAAFSAASPSRTAVAEERPRSAEAPVDTPAAWPSYAPGTAPPAASPQPPLWPGGVQGAAWPGNNSGAPQPVASTATQSTWPPTGAASVAAANHPQGPASAMPNAAAPPPRAPARRPVSPYAGAVSAAVGPASLAAGQTRPQTAVPPAPMAPNAAGQSSDGNSIAAAWSAPTAPPSIMAVIKQEEESLAAHAKDEYLFITFYQKLTLSFSQAWEYKLNLFIAGVVLFGFHIVAYNYIHRVLFYTSNNFAVGLISSAVMTFVMLMLWLGFANLVVHILTSGEPDSTVRLVTAPWLRLPQLVLPLMMMIGVINLIQFVFIYKVGVGNGGLTMAMIALCLLSPLGFCYAFYLVDNDDFSLVDGLVQPLYLFFENIGGWLSIILIAALAMFCYMLLLLLAGYFLGPFIFLLWLFIIEGLLIVAGYITFYAGYTYKQILADIEDDDG